MKKRLTVLGVIPFLFVLAFSAFATTTSALLPVADGSYSSWTPKSGTTHYTQVDETPCNGTTDYNSTTVVGNRDSYKVSSSSVPNAAQVTDIAIKPCASRVSSGGSDPVMNVFYRLNGVDSADAGSYSLTGTTPVELGTTTFSGLSFIKTPSIDLQVGAVLSTSTKGARLSRIATTITYTSFTAPNSLSATATTTNAVSLTWNDTSTFEDAFSIERKFSTTSSSFVAIATTTANTITFYNAPVNSGTGYQYRVRGYNAGGFSSYSNTSIATTTPIGLSAPSGLSATASSSSEINLHWTDNSVSETAYVIERRDVTASTTFTGIATTSADVVSFNDSGLSGNTTYAYRVRAYDDTSYSAYSNESSATTYESPIPSPSNFTTSATTSSAVALSWTDNSVSETGFSIERKYATTSSSFAVIATTTANKTSYYNKSLGSGTAYLYRVQAYNTEQSSAYSVESSATTTPTGLTAPSSLNATATSSSEINLGWIDNSNAEVSFVIESRDVTASTTFTGIATTTANVISYADMGLTASTTYSYRVRAFDGSQYSAYSNTANATTNP